jgi:F5/8 type C domain
MLRSALIWSAVTFSSVIGGSAVAGVVLSPVSGTASNTYSGGGTPISNTYDQTGLSPGFVSGVTDWSTYFGADPLKDFGYTNEWFTDAGVTSAVVTYDLGAVYKIDDFALWEEDSTGIGETNVLVSTDGVTWTPLLTGIVPTQTALDENYGAQFFPFATVAARYIELDILEAPNPAAVGGYDGAAIGEVAFEGSSVPEPATWALLSCGFAALGLLSGSRRARRRPSSIGSAG